VGVRFGAVRGGLPPYDVARRAAARCRLLSSRGAWTIAVEGRTDKTPVRVISTRGLTAQGGDERAGPGPEQGVGGPGERALLQVRAAEQTSSQVVCGTARRGGQRLPAF
jgi:hypothetical protein